MQRLEGKAGVNQAKVKRKMTQGAGRAHAKTQRPREPTYSLNQPTEASIGLFGHLSVRQAYHSKTGILLKFYDLMLC